MTGQMICTEYGRGKKELLKRHKAVRFMFEKKLQLLGGEWNGDPG